jgi:hypothetical protein
MLQEFGRGDIHREGARRTATAQIPTELIPD